MHAPLDRRDACPTTGFVWTGRDGGKEALLTQNILHDRTLRILTGVVPGRFRMFPGRTVKVHGRAVEVPDRAVDLPD